MHQESWSVGLGGARPGSRHGGFDCALDDADPLFQLITHQAPFTNGHPLNALLRRRNTRAYQEGLTQLDVDSERQLSVGRLFVVSSVVYS